MDTIIVGCKTLENELLQAVKETGCTYEIRWIESGLHNYPKKLNQVLQETLNGCGAGRVLAAMGFCGNSIENISTEDYTLIFPRVDDCISLLLGSCRRRMEISREHGTYFLTEGWLKGERNIWKEYEYTMEKYGEETGKEIFQIMLGNYRSLALLDTGCYSMEKAGAEAKNIAGTLELEYKILPATLDYMKKLLTGPWTEEEFLIVPPHSMVQGSDLVLEV